MTNSQPMRSIMEAVSKLCEATDDPRRIYRSGMCDAMALALHEVTRLPLGLWRGFFPDEFGEDGDEGYEDCHAVVVVSFDPPRWIDVDGVHDGEPDNCHFNEKVTRRQLVPASKRDVREAFTTEHFKPAIVRQAKRFIASDPVLSKLVTSLTEGRLLDSVAAWHASPHRFDAFSTDFIGVGEGNQSYGWGLYFASDSKVMDTYTMLRSLVDKDGNPIKLNLGSEEERDAFEYIVRAKGNCYLAAQMAEHEMSSDDEDDQFGEPDPEEAMVQRIIADFYYRGVHISPHTGTTYHVSLPDGEYLDWNRTFDAQPPLVQRALQTLLSPKALLSRSGGGGLYGLLVHQYGSPKAASAALALHGVVGVKYLDGFSRQLGTGSHNYVVFDARNVEIIDKSAKGSLSEAALPPGFPQITRDLAVDVIDQCMRFGFELDLPDEEIEDEREELESYVESRLYGILDEIRVHVRRGRLPIYRAIAVLHADDLVTEHLGIYWSTTPRSAHPYNGDDRMPWLRITAAVNVSDIDWVSTLALHLEGGEDEVRLASDVPVKILAADWITTGQRSLQHLVGRTLFT